MNISLSNIETNMKKNVKNLKMNLKDFIHNYIILISTDNSGKPRGRYARVAFELTLRNLGLVTSYPGWPLSSADNQPASPGVPHGLGHSMRAAQRSLRLGPSPAGHGPDRPYRGLKPADLSTSHAWDGLRERDGSPRLRPGRLPGRS